jgi:hypothetical protein
MGGLVQQPYIEKDLTVNKTWSTRNEDLMVHTIKWAMRPGEGNLEQTMEKGGDDEYQVVDPRSTAVSGVVTSPFFLSFP